MLKSQGRQPKVKLSNFVSPKFLMPSKLSKKSPKVKLLRFSAVVRSGAQGAQFPPHFRRCKEFGRHCKEWSKWKPKDSSWRKEKGMVTLKNWKKWHERIIFLVHVRHCHKTVPTNSTRLTLIDKTAQNISKHTQTQNKKTVSHPMPPRLLQIFW